MEGTLDMISYSLTHREFPLASPLGKLFLGHGIVSAETDFWKPSVKSPFQEIPFMVYLNISNICQYPVGVQTI